MPFLEFFSKQEALLLLWLRLQQPFLSTYEIKIKMVDKPEPKAVTSKGHTSQTHNTCMVTMYEQAETSV